MAASGASTSKAIRKDFIRALTKANLSRFSGTKIARSSYTVTALPFSGTTTVVACPFISATNLSAFGSMIGNEP